MQLIALKQLVRNCLDLFYTTKEFWLFLVSWNLDISAILITSRAIVLQKQNSRLICNNLAFRRSNKTAITNQSSALDHIYMSEICRNEPSSNKSVKISHICPSFAQFFSLSDTALKFSHLVQKSTHFITSPLHLL